MTMYKNGVTRRIEISFSMTNIKLNTTVTLQMHTKVFDGITPYNIITIEVHRHYLAFTHFPITTHWDLVTLNSTCSDNIEATSAHLSSIFCKPLTVGLNNNISSAYKIHPRNTDEIQHPTPKSLKRVIKRFMKTLKIAGEIQAALSYTTICCKIRWYTTIPSYSIG